MEDKVLTLTEWLNGRELTPELLLEFKAYLRALGIEKVYKVKTKQ